MATIVLSAAGMALGGSIGGSVMGLSMAAVGRAAGAAIGRRIDQRLLGSGSASVEVGRVDRFRIAGAAEGDPLTQVYGRMRVPGHIIWASRFQESKTTHGGGGKGGPPKPKTTEYSYSISLAVALCPGEIARVGRVWADGSEVDLSHLNMRVYPGSDTQLPDPKMEAVEGFGNVPDYRGIAYVVLEDLELGQFGNRVPQLNFEVHRPAQDGSGMSDVIEGVAMIPGTGEYALATKPVTVSRGYGEEAVANMNNGSGATDFVASLDALEGELPHAKSVSLVVSWFGDDLRIGHCRVRPKVEQNEVDGSMPWTVGGLSRTAAGTVPEDEGRPVYGGTPADASVIQSIREMNRRGMNVTFYPFVLMEQMSENTLPDPYTGEPGQPVLPWRGRITTERAPGVAGTTDGTAAARAEVDAFFDGPEGFDAFILHYAQLCADAGGVEAFCIGSELRGITEIRDHEGYPAVARLKSLAARVKAILPSAKIGYAADWSEYHGHQPVGTSDKIFHLDPLWADPNIDFVGIDNYMPLSDWRDGDHLDSHWGDVSNINYLRANIAGGEMFDWYYHSEEARAAQIRTPITDGDGEPWVWRQKDLRGWWENAHHNRVGGVRSAQPTQWQPGMKPIWFTEYGCAAIDRGTNQPNKFLDPKSSESLLPRYSRGYRDDFIQHQYIRAMTEHFADADNNPTHPGTGHQMVDMSHGFVWAWDGRPWPAFPSRSELWSDGGNYKRGHWLNGRATAQPLASVVAEICDRAGVVAYDTSQLRGMVRGYSHEDTASGREALQPLMIAYGFDAVERFGVLTFLMRGSDAMADLDAETLAIGSETNGLPEVVRAGEVETSDRVRLGYVDADGVYEVRTIEAAAEGEEASVNVTGSELSLAMTSGEAQAIAERWLTESRAARSTVSFALPPSRGDIGAGDVVRLDDADWRIDRVESAGARQIEAVRVDGRFYEPVEREDSVLQPTAARNTPVPVVAEFLDLPLLRGDETPHAPYVAFGARPWPGPVALQSSVDDSNYILDRIEEQPATMGLTLNDLGPAAAGVWDRGEALLVQLVQGSLSFRSQADVLAGANLAAVGDGSPNGWEVIQFAEAELVGDRTYALRQRLRGQGGTDGALLLPSGSRFVLIDSRVRQIDLAPQSRGVARHYRWGPADRAANDPTWRHAEMAFAGVGLRPYPVAHVRAVGGQATWVRRTRVDGDSWNGFEVPLGEEREAYVVRLLSGGVVVREETVNAPSWTFDPAQGDAIEVAQLSASFGPGPFRRVAL